MLPISYTRHQVPPAVIQHALWLYLRFTLSYLNVKDLLAEWGLSLVNSAPALAAIVMIDCRGRRFRYDA
jgi:hypothetical protein